MTDALAALETLTFDAALAELERTVAELETGGLPLEETIARYERGVALERRCEQLLADAELRVRRLVEGARGALALAELRLDGESAETLPGSTESRSGSAGTAPGSAESRSGSNPGTAE